jgi:hypothetical protein
MNAAHRTRSKSDELGRRARFTQLLDFSSKRRPRLVAHTPTLVTFERHARLLDPAAWNDPTLRLLPRHWREGFWALDGPMWFMHDLTPEDLAALREALPKMREFVRGLHAGARVHAGSDATMPHVVPGASLHEELAEFVAAGLTIEDGWATARCAGPANGWRSGGSQ